MRRRPPPGRWSRILNAVVAALAAAVWVLGAIPALAARLLADWCFLAWDFLTKTQRSSRGKPRTNQKASYSQQREWRVRALALSATIFALAGLAWRPSPSGAVPTDDALVVMLPAPSPWSERDGDPFARLPPLPAPSPPLPPPTPAPAPPPDPFSPPDLSPAPSPPPTQKCDTPRHPHQVSMRWHDHNDLATEFSAELVLDAVAVEAAVDGYGVPDGYLRLWNVGSVRERFQQRGVAVTMGSDGVARMATDYAEMVRRAHLELGCVARIVADAVAGVSDGRSRLGALASMVQDIPYPADKVTPIPKQRRLSNGTTVHTIGFRVPLETLALREGDCDSKTTLFSGLMKALGGPNTLLVTGEGHQFGGIELAPRRGERYVEMDGRTFVLVEFTAPLPLGTIADDSWRHVRNGVLELLVP